MLHKLMAPERDRDKPSKSFVKYIVPLSLYLCDCQSVNTAYDCSGTTQRKRLPGFNREKPKDSGTAQESTEASECFSMLLWAGIEHGLARGEVLLILNSSGFVCRRRVGLNV